MPILQNPRHEAFAQARAGGARLDQAYEDAGFTPGHGHASRLAFTPGIAERIAEIRAENAPPNPQSIVAALWRIGSAAPKDQPPGALKEARLALLDAAALLWKYQEFRKIDQDIMLRDR